MILGGESSSLFAHAVAMGWIALPFSHHSLLASSLSQFANASDVFCIPLQLFCCDVLSQMIRNHFTNLFCIKFTFLNDIHQMHLHMNPEPICFSASHWIEN
mmetsp:Transcript_1369/g.4723  ORF Transcript_1369/g.4723 Transcript_1369/m.4723 type:complete len:101 (-) Transcript_1369:614-916(-)